MYHQRRNNNEERRARLAGFVLYLFPNIMRCCVAHFKDKNGYYTKYCNKKRNPPVLTPTELLLLDELPQVENFTIQLCYKFISFEEVLPTPLKGWGNFPDNKALKVEDDIERLRHVINEIIGINCDECTENYLIKFLYKLERIIQRFQIILGTIDLGKTTVYDTYKSVLTQKIDTAAVLEEFKIISIIDSDVQYVKLQDRTRYSKISAVITEFFPRIIRHLIPLTITPPTVHAFWTLPGRKWNKTQKIQIQNLQYCKNFEPLDATMLYQLFRSFLIVPGPTQGWGNEPEICDIEIADDIERIRFLRNKSAHRCDTRIDQTEFDNYFLQFREITQRIAVGYCHELTAIEEGSLDPKRQIELERALQALEGIKERFKKNNVTFYWGNDFDSKIKNIRQKIQTGNEILGNDDLPTSLVCVSSL